MIESPCTRKCSYDLDEDVCFGCFRNLKEITGWWQLSEEQQHDILRRIDARRQRYSSSGEGRAIPPHRVRAPKKTK